jgi:hypothetical protein
MTYTKVTECVGEKVETALDGHQIIWDRARALEDTNYEDLFSLLPEEARKLRRGRFRITVEFTPEEP